MNLSPPKDDFRPGTSWSDYPEQRVGRLRYARHAAQLFLIVGDILLLLGAFYLATEIRHQGEPGPHSWLFHGLQLIPFYVVVGLYNGNYSQAGLDNARMAIRQVIITIMIATGLRLFMSFGAKNTSEFSRAIFLMAITFSTIILCLLRGYVTATMHRRFGKRLENILIVEDGGAPVPISRAHRIALRGRDVRENPNDPEMLDQFGRIARDMDRVIISCERKDWADWAIILKGLNIRGEIVSDGMYDLGALGLHHGDGFTSLIISTGPLGLRDRAAKRALDLSLAVFTIVLLAPLLLAIALAIKLEDGGPVLFVQKRTGRANCTFKMLKFRSMHVNQGDRNGDRSTTPDDERVTRIGRIIRRTSLDELPQLLNVIRGEMSLVGPRPHALGSKAGGKLFWNIDPRYWHRHTLKPGLTGLAQVRGHRGATDDEKQLIDRLGADLEYINQWSPWRDIVILVRTVNVLMHKRAY